MFEKEIEEYERVRVEYQQKVAGRMGREHLVAFFFKTAIERMKSEMAQKRKNSLPLIFF